MREMIPRNDPIVKNSLETAELEYEVFPGVATYILRKFRANTYVIRIFNVALIIIS